MSSAYSFVNSLTIVKFFAVAALTVDGIRDPTFFHGHCAHTNERDFAKNWVQVDMGKDRYVDYIALVSRDVEVLCIICAQRLTNFTIGLTSTSATVVSPVRDQYPMCGRYRGNVPIATRVTLQCNANLPAYRYIIVHQAVGAYNGYLGFCELEAYEPLAQMIFPFKQFPAVRLAFCVGRCMQLGEVECDSFNFNQQLGVCQLNRHRNGYQIGELLPNVRWEFWNVNYHYIGNI
ncbi:hypothetical protein HELRODRAFT_179321 [Helobdella robusta]|uniref:Apple domain-containing protein n=1 Tax=Helobdella robusta TaxID=6412 RepID=T1FEJ5_HELRO|nr:hypothetical protein HELRODRAFT_179321 [Helobdella robusta]ESN95545.1 hypothetical protein HELRODRAFT_179321 [Helobdella robusta]